MKTLIMNGSPRPEGDTAGLIGELIRALPGEVMTVDAYRSGIAPCIDCRWCRKNEGCRIEDGMQEVYDFIRDCDNAVIASPVYFSELTGRLLDVASRFQTYFSGEFFRKEPPDIAPKRGAVILVGGNAGSMDKALSTARILLRRMNCREITEPVLCGETDKRPALRDAAALAGVRDIARFFAGETAEG